MPGSTEYELIFLQSVVQPQHRLHEPVDRHVCLSKPRCTSRSTRRFPRSQVDTFSRVPPWEHQYAIVPSRLQDSFPLSIAYTYPAQPQTLPPPDENRHKHKTASWEMAPPKGVVQLPRLGQISAHNSSNEPTIVGECLSHSRTAWGHNPSPDQYMAFHIALQCR